MQTVAQSGPDLFSVAGVELPPIVHPEPEQDQTIQERFEAFHKANPHVYEIVVGMARQLYHKGRKRISISMIFEVLRYEYLIRTEGDAFRLNNDFRSRYVRMLREREPALGALFETRELRSP